MTNEEMLSVAEIVERATNRFHQQAADHEAKMVEHRAAFGARTKADAETIDRLHTERDGLRAKVAALQERLRASIARGDFAQMEVAALKSQTPKHPVKVGEWVKRLKPIVFGSGTIAKVLSINENDRPPTYTVEHIDGYEEFWIISNCEPCDPPQTGPVPKRAHPVAVGGYLRRLTGFNTIPAGEVARVTHVDDDDPSQVEYEVVRPNGQKGRWSAKGCEPCDPPTADHDTPEGKDAAESVIRNDRKTEPADDVKEGDVVEVVSATHRIYTEHEDLGCRGVVTVIDGMRLLLGEVPGYKLPIRGIVGKCDVRKVTT